MLKKIIIGLVVVIGLLAVVVSFQPATFRVERSVLVNAPAEAAFVHVNDLRKWNDWSPWARKDPAMKQTYSDPSAGVGAASSWAGNHQVGEGRMTIEESRPNELVRIKLEFLKPFSATNRAEFSFGTEGGQTRVTWSMTGENNFMAKAIHLVMDMDKMVGGDFEKGLAALKSTVEIAATSEAKN